MKKNKVNYKNNHERSVKLVGYVPRKAADPKTYEELGFMCGLEVHQQLKTGQKLFCRCPNGPYHGGESFDAEVVRHMRPTLSELGEYDGTALMEFRTKKNIIYRLNNLSACTYEIDDTPPFPLNMEALNIAMEIALLLKTNVVGELHITRKQYLDGSIPTGFQRTAIVGIEGEFPISRKTIRVIQLSIEEDSCREVSDVGHWRTYTTDRLGIPLIETVTYPDMKTPDEAAEAAHYIRFLARSTGHVRTGIGAAREDVNVSVTGGTRVEIKGVSHISWIPELTHNEAFRQKALLDIRKILKDRVKNPDKWKISHEDIPRSGIPKRLPFDPVESPEIRAVAVNLPQFDGILSFFTQPGQSFANELTDRLKVIACIEKPNMVHSEPWGPDDRNIDFNRIKKILKSEDGDAQLIIWGPEEDIPTALETIEERCQLAFEGVPNETRKSFADGTTIFERVLPGPDRMYPDTDSAPIPLEESQIQTLRDGLPPDVSTCIQQMKKWKIPEDTYTYILKRNLFPLIQRIINDFKQPPPMVGTLVGHQLKHVEGRVVPDSPFNDNRVYELFEFIIRKKLKREILKEMLPMVYHHPAMDFPSVLSAIGYKRNDEEDILSHIPLLKEKFLEIRYTESDEAMTAWVMGELRPMALGNMNLKELKDIVKGTGNSGGQDEQ